ncbi:unnamed protein product [Rhizoctonia solani]|uniref:Glutathione S-transferase n=1 Tax=Rhizoctonia solani TaxID=456999 RepID=A0A8H2Y4N5_9AGAM|nr:unnamed protein product [Rhizoctonia solani]
MSPNIPLLYTVGTPNGHKVSIILEELKDAYRFQYEVRKIDLQKNEQKEPWFLKVNPNGRIPALVDRSRDNFAVFESAAILLYVAQHYDIERKFSYDPVIDSELYSEQLQWIFFTHGGIGPMQGQAAHFHRYAPEKIPYAINRYIDETKRLYSGKYNASIPSSNYNYNNIVFQRESVLNDRLADREYLVGPGKGKYGVADINTFPWVRASFWVGIDNLDAFPNVEAWVKRIAERPQVKNGLDAPDPQGPPMTKDEKERAAEEGRK